MSTENHIGLPPEIFEIVLRYLNIKDILSCSLVCTGWRHAANCDRVWQSICENSIPAHHLKTIISKTEKLPRHHNDENVSVLMPLWKKRFSDYVRLKGNWKAGRPLEVSFENFVTCEVPFQTDYDVLIECQSYHTYGIYNVMDESPDLTSKLFCAKIDDRTDEPHFFKLENNVLVVAHNKLMQVFTKDGSYTRKLVAAFDEDPHQCPQVPISLNIAEWYKERYGFDCEYFWVNKAHCDHNGKYFVGILCHTTNGINPDSHFHVWDLETFTKVKKVKLPDIGEDEWIGNLTFSINKSTVGLHVRTKNGDVKMCIYDLEKMCYSGGVLHIDYKAPLVFFAERMAIYSNDEITKVFLYNLAEGRLSATIETPELERRSDEVPCIGVTPHASGILLLYAGWLHRQKKSVTQVTAYNLSELTQMDTFPVPPADINIEKLHIHMDDLMIMGTNIGLMVRDMKSREHLYTLSYMEFIPPDSTGTMMIVWEFEDVGMCQPVVLHFW